VAEAAQQPRQHPQGVQCHLHGGNEDGMDASRIRPSVLGVLRRVLSVPLVQSCWCYLLSSAPVISDEPWPETLVVCSGGGVTWTGDISCSYA